MVGGRLCCLSSVFTFSAVLLLGFCLHDVEGSSCPPIIHKTVGDTVEFPSCLSTDGVTAASWKFRDKIVADTDQSEDTQFRGRVYLNPTNFSLTVRRLTLQDSGNFSFLSEANDQQRETITITLQVHVEPLTKPVLKVNSTWHASNQSCTLLLECSASDSGVTYNWTVGNQQRSGPRLQYIIRPQDGETEFTCTIFNFVTKESVSKTEKCTNSTDSPKREAQSHVLYLGVAAGCFVFIFAVSIVICVCHHKKRRTGCDTNDLTVYADISDVAIQRTSSTMKPCSVYETIDNRVSTVTPGPQTVYDQIQFGHVRKAPVPPKL